jgi:glucose-6-phosphate dehydrogenase assembly protein OpcA
MAPIVTGAESPAIWDGHVASARDLAGVLAGLHPTGEDGRPLSVAAVLNLVVVADGDDAESVEQVIESLADHQPSRALIVERIPDGDGIDAHIAARAQVVGSAGDASRVELLHLRLHGAAAQGAASAIQALLRTDLPVYVWWPGPPPTGDPTFADLSRRADRLILEASELGGADALGRLAAAVTDRGPAVTDLAWAALTPWRQLINQLITREHLEQLRGSATVTLCHVGELPPLGALLLAGWLVDSIGPSARIGFRPDVPDGRADVCEVRLDDGASRTITIDRVSGRSAASVLIRDPDGMLHERMMPMPEPSRSELLAGELELQRRDHPFERALRHARGLVRPQSGPT